MVRPPRIHHPGLIYHVINRGNNKQTVFHDDEDYRRYLGIIYRYKRQLDFHLFAFCLMPNHVHLLIQVTETSSISTIMQKITLSHTRHLHHKYQRCGHIWQGRFRSPIVSDDIYLENVLRYIEQNPLRAGMVRSPDDYPWSSYRLNVRDKAPKLIDREQNPLYIKSGSDPYRWRTEHRRRVNAGLTDEILDPIQNSTRGIGHYISQQFAEHLDGVIPIKKRRGRPRGINR